MDEAILTEHDPRIGLPDELERREWSPSPRAGMLTEFIVELERKGILYCVLRGQQEFPNLHSGGDIDVLVAPSSEMEAIRAIELCAERHGVTIWERRRSGALHEFHLYARQGPGRHEFFGVDLHTAETCFGIPFLGAADFLPLSRKVAGLQRPEPIRSACLDAFGPFLSSGSIPPAHSARFVLALAVDPHGIRTELTRWFGARLAGCIVDAADSTPDFAARLPLGSLRLALLSRAAARAPLASLRGFLGCLWTQRVRPWFRPRGRFVAFLGTDGSGKSTLIQGVLDQVADAFGEQRLRSFHFRPGLLPQIDALFHGGRTRYSLADMSRPHRAKPSGALGSTLRAAYYGCDFVVGYLARVLPCRRRPVLVAFDRYVYDYLVDPLRSRIRRGAPLLEAICGLCPTPDVVIVCTASVETVRSRKREISEEESRAQIEAYEAFAHRHPRAVLVRNEGQVEDAVDAALGAIFGQGRP